MVLSREEGRDTRDAAEQVGVTRQTVGRCPRRLIEKGITLASESQPKKRFTGERRPR
jgi:transposase